MKNRNNDNNKSQDCEGKAGAECEGEVKGGEKRFVIRDEKYVFGLTHLIRGPKGGIQCTDMEQVRRQRGVAMEILKELGNNIMSGKSLTSISMPVTIFEPQSFLQRLTFGWSFAPYFFDLAAECTKDPLKRFKIITAFAVAGLHQCLNQLKPFNPILGETYQGYFADGTQIYLEQISHHPPISAFQLFSKSNKWQFYGHNEYVANMLFNYLIGHQKGPNIVKFEDGGSIQYELPKLWVLGIGWGDRILHWNDELVVKDEKNNLECVITFGPKKQTSLWGSSDNRPLDVLEGTIHKLGDRSSTVCKVTGSWIDGISFDGDKSFWPGINKCEWRPYKLIGSKDYLPSDCRGRSDLNALLKGDLEAAKEKKKELENIQRRDRSLRKQYGEDHKGSH